MLAHSSEPDTHPKNDSRLRTNITIDSLYRAPTMRPQQSISGAGPPNVVLGPFLCKEHED